MALRIGELVGLIRADDSGMRRGLANAAMRMRRLQGDMEARLRDLRGRFVSESRRLGNALGNGVRNAGERARAALRRLIGLVGGLGRLAVSIGRIAAMIGAAVPVAAGLAAAIGDILPASGVAVTGLLAVVSATAAVKIGMSGVKDAIAASFDPKKAKQLDAAMKGLSPNARAFVKALQGLKPQLDRLKKSVQDKLFDGLDSVLKRTAKSTLPLLRKNIQSSAGALNEMAKGVIGAAGTLARSGTLGQALASSTKGLHNLANVPGIVVTGLGQIAAAAGPSFQRLTGFVSDAAVEIGNKLGNAFRSGALQDAIENAISLIGELVDVGANVGRILGSVFSAAQVSGGGFIGTLKTITGSMADAFASPEVQGGLKALFSTMSQLAKTAAPLLGKALKVIGPVLEKLGPPVQALIKALGDALSPIIDALGPVLVTAAEAVGTLITALSPLLPVIGDLVAALLPALTPLLDAVNRVFIALAPVISDVASILVETLSPILDALPGIIEPLAKILADRLVFFLQLLGEILIALAPSLVSLGQSFGEILVALAPLLEVLAELIGDLLEGLMPILTPLIKLVGDLAAVFADQLAGFISNVVVPALEIVSDLLRGDFSDAADVARRAAINIVVQCVQAFQAMPGQIHNALGGLASALRDQMILAAARLISAAENGIANAVDVVASLPGKARSVLSNLGGVLFGAGASLIAGFVAGIVSRIPSIQSVLGGITSRLPDWKGPKGTDAKILAPAGRMVIRGFQRGIDQQTPALRRQLQGLTATLPSSLAVAGMPAAGGSGRAVDRRTTYDQRTYNFTARPLSMQEFNAFQRRQDAIARVGRPH